MTPVPGITSQTGLGIALALGAMLLFASCAIGVSLAVRRLGSDTGALISAAVNLPLGLVVLALQLVHSGPLRAPTLLGVSAFVAGGLFSTYLGRWLFFKSVETMGAARSSSFQTSSPLVTAFFGWLLLGEYLSPLALAGMAMGVLGLMVTSQGAGKPAPPASTASQTVPAPRPAGKPAVTARGVLLLGLGSSAAYAISNVARAAGVRAWDEPVAGATLGAAAGLAALLLVNRRQLGEVRSRIAASPAGAWIYGAVGVMQFTAQSLVIASMAHIPASFAALISMCSPLIVLPVSLVLFRNSEGIRLSTVLGMAATIAGVALVVLQTR